MKESVTCEAIVEEGKIQARQEDLLRLGRKRFGPPTASTERALRNLTDLDRLARLLDRLLDVSDWEELLATP